MLLPIAEAAQGNAVCTLLEDPMTMAPALPGVCGDAKRVVDELHKRNYSVMAEITARIGAFGLLASVLQTASAIVAKK